MCRPEFQQVEKESMLDLRDDDRFWLGLGLRNTCDWTFAYLAAGSVQDEKGAKCKNEGGDGKSCSHSNKIG